MISCISIVTVSYFHLSDGVFTLAEHATTIFGTSTLAFGVFLKHYDSHFDLILVKLTTTIGFNLLSNCMKKVELDLKIYYLGPILIFP